MARGPVYDLARVACLWIAEIEQAAASMAEKGRIVSCAGCTELAAAEFVLSF